LATNYTFSSSPGANIGARVATGDETLASLLMKNRTFRQVWETGASQASTNLARRGAVEESMGYGHALTRTRGAPLSQTGFEGPSGTVFAPERPEDLPKYAALVSKHQRYGVAPRYGPSVVYWKRDLRNRITHTPGDSWNLESQGSLMSFASASHPEAVLRHMDPLLLRLAAAEATGKDAEFLKGVKAKGGVSTDAYVETQIHGELSWEDVDHIVIGAQETNAEGLVAEFRRFARAKGYTFTVTLRED
jgi:hypothetical protein